MTVKMRTTGLRALILMISLLLLLCWTQSAEAEDPTVFNVNTGTTISEIQSRISDDTTTTFVFPADGTARSWNGTAFTLTRDNKIIHFVFPEGSKVYFNAVPGNPLFTCAAGVQNAGVVISGPGSLTVYSGTSLIDNGNFTLDGTNLSAKEMTGAAFSADGKTFRMISGTLTVSNCGAGFDWNGPITFESGTVDISGSGGTGPIRTSGALTFGSSADNAAALIVNLSTDSAASAKNCITFAATGTSTGTAPSLTIEKNASVTCSLPGSTGGDCCAIYCETAAPVTIRGSLDITAADSEGSAEPLSGSVGIYEAAAITIPENGIFTANGIEKAVKGTGTGIDFQSGAIVQLDRAEIVTASPDIIISSGAVNYLQPDGAAPVNDYGDKVYPFDLQKYTGTGFQLYSKIGGTDYLYKVSSEEGGTIVWAPKAVITFMADDKVSGTCETMAGMTAGFSETSLPADPAKDGYVFEGWYTEDGEQFDPQTTVFDSDTIVYAKFTPIEKPVPDENSDSTGDTGTTIGTITTMPFTGIRNGQRTLLLIIFGIGAAAAAVAVIVRKRENQK
jgi:uncharacterized repeat protein (TIGR02543 family)